jgi:hypothetical protein
MTTSQEFARLAIEIGQLAEQTKRCDLDERFLNSVLLINYQLRAAASKAREIAEALAKQENLTP